MLVSKYLSEFCQVAGLTTIYHYIGGMTIRFIDEIGKNKNLKLVTLRHEQGAGFAANAHSRITHKPTLTLATSGPGATNLVTPIADCYFDHIPAIFITGQVNTHEQNQNSDIRQIGFQETDIVNICKPITKLSMQVTKGSDFPSALKKAYKIATTAPFGPVLLDVPMNVQKEECADDKISFISNISLLCENCVDIFLDNQLNMLITDLQNAKKPLLLFGHGVSLSCADEECARFSEKYSIPIVHSLHGVDVAISALNFGLIGSYGNRYANIALCEADFVLALGTRFDVRQLGANVNYFEANKVIYHVDINPSQFNVKTKNAIGIEADIKGFIEALAKKNISCQSNDFWLEKLSLYKKKFSSLEELAIDNEDINPNKFVYLLSEKFPEVAGYTTDVGKNQMYVAQSIQLKKGQRVLFSGGHGSMGFSLPAAIGMAFATNKEVICFNGDGGLQMNIQELQTIKHYNLPIKIIVFQNNALGMVQQFQEDYHENRLYGTVDGYSAPNFTALAFAYGIEGKKISKANEVDEAIKWLKSSRGACLLEIVISNKVKLYPKLMFGNNLDTMYPYKDV